MSDRTGQGGCRQYCRNPLFLHYFYIKPAPNYYEPINIRIHGITEKLTDSAPSFGELWQAELSDYVQGRGMMKVHPNEDPHLAELY